MHCTNTFVILNVELARHVKDLFCEAKFTLEESEQCSHHRKVDATSSQILRTIIWVTPISVFGSG